MSVNNIHCSLPETLKRVINKIIVNRCGAGVDAMMITKEVTGVIEPNYTYTFNLGLHQRLQCVNSFPTPFIQPSILKEPIIPQHVILKGKWCEEESLELKDANILGGMGELILDKSPSQSIPVLKATRENLAFYNAKLIAPDVPFTFETNEPLPITEMYVGKNYVKGYLSRAELGGGEYIEYHDKPHFWAPRTPHSTGHILLSRKYHDQFYFTGFTIPYGYGVYLHPYTRHSDAYLIGDYTVVYSVTENYSTVLFKNHEREPVRLAFDD